MSGGPVSMRTGPDGALYVASLGGGRIARFAPKMPLTCGTDAGVDMGAPDTGTVMMDSGVAADTDVADSEMTADTEIAPDSAMATTPTDTGSSDEDAATIPAAGTDDGGGCGCVTVGARGASALPLGAFVALAILRRRRR